MLSRAPQPHCWIELLTTTNFDRGCLSARDRLCASSPNKHNFAVQNRQGCPSWHHQTRKLTHLRQLDAPKIKRQNITASSALQTRTSPWSKPIQRHMNPTVQVTSKVSWTWNATPRHHDCTPGIAWSNNINYHQVCPNTSKLCWKLSSGSLP